MYARQVFHDELFDIPDSFTSFLSFEAAAELSLLSRAFSFFVTKATSMYSRTMATFYGL